MTKFSFIKNSKEKLIVLIEEFEEFIKDDTSISKATNLSINVWHMSDWVFKEFQLIHKETDKGLFRNTLYQRCPSLKLFHDIANDSKHSIMEPNRVKTSIKESRRESGAYQKYYTNSYEKTRLDIELEDGSILNFLNELKTTIDFWKDYFKNDLDIELG